MAEDVRTNTLALGQINPATKTLEQHVYPTTSQSKTAFTQKHMIFVRITNRQQRIAVLAIPINVEKQSTERVATKRYTPFLIALAMNDNRALVTVQVCQPQITQFCQADTGIPQQPENSAIASSVHVGDRANFVTSSVYQHRRPLSEQRMDLQRELPFFPVATMLVTSGGYEVGNPYRCPACHPERELWIWRACRRDPKLALRMTCLISKYLPL